MADQPKPDKKASPKGINPKTGESYEPVKRDEWDKMLKRVAKSKG